MSFHHFDKIVFGLLVSAWLVFGANMAGDLLVRAQALDTPAYQVAGGGEPAASGGGEAAAPGEDALTLLASVDAAAGAKAFKKCKACHTTDKGGANRVGPNLWDVVGRAKAGAEGFSYSGALKGLGGEWTYRDLDHFIADPKGFAKGTKMSFAGTKKAQDRAAVLQYLRSLSDSPKPLP